MRKLRAVALVVALVARAPDARADVSTILILGGGLGVEETRLVEALRIYTGDVDGRLVLAGKAPSSLAPAAIDALTDAARKEGAEVVVWGGRRADARTVFYLLDVGAHDLRETEIEPLGAERAAEDVALKVRALLFRRRARAAAVRRTAEAAPATPPTAPPDGAPPPDGATAPAPPSEVAIPTVVAPPIDVAPPSVVAPPPAAVAPPATLVVAQAAVVEAPVFHRLGLSAAYEIVLPTDPTWLRNGVVFGAELRLGRRATTPLSLVVDGAIVTRPTSIVRGFSVTVGDVPLGVGLLLTRAGSVASLAAGPRASLHIFDVSASDADGPEGSARRYALGLGGAARVDVRLATYMKAWLGATIEGLVPKQQFTIAGQRALDTGAMLTCGTVGLEWLLL